MCELVPLSPANVKIMRDLQAEEQKTKNIMHQCQLSLQHKLFIWGISSCTTCLEFLHHQYVLTTTGNVKEPIASVHMRKSKMD